MTSLLNWQWDLGIGKPILVREIVGNGFGLASALGGMRRRVWAWPVGIAGNVLLFTVFLGGVFDTPSNRDLWGQAGRQVFFLALSGYGWWLWTRRTTRSSTSGPDTSGPGAAVFPRWATPRERIAVLIAAAALTAIIWPTLIALHSWGPKADTWILVGSILATYGMARGWVEFWLVWIAVDAVGVPLLWRAEYYPSAIMYLVYGAFCLLGFWRWARLRPTSPATSSLNSVA